MEVHQYSINLLPTQYKFYTSEAMNVAYVGGYGSGKTRALCELAIKSAISNPYAPGALVAPTYGMLNDPVLVKLEELMEEKKMKYTINKASMRILLPEIPTSIVMMSGDKPERIKGPDWSFVGVDEAATVKELSWKNCIARVRHPLAKFRKRFIATTPEGLDNWVYVEFVEKVENAKVFLIRAAEELKEIKAKGKKPNPTFVKRVKEAYRRVSSYEIFFASSRENTFLDAEVVLELENAYDEKLVQAYVEGKFIDLSGSHVYYAFGPHNVSNKVVFNINLPVFVSCDFNVQPMCWVLFQYHHSKIWVFDEIFIENNADTALATDKMLGKLKVLWAGFNYSGLEIPQHITIFGDPAGRARTTAGDTDYAIIEEILRQNRIGFVNAVSKAAPLVKDKINNTNSAIQDREGVGSRILIHPRCENLIKDFQHVKRAKDGGIDKRNLKWSHMTDALGYAISEIMPIRRRGEFGVGSTHDLF